MRIDLSGLLFSISMHVSRSGSIVTGVLPVNEAIQFFVNRRSRTLTAYGWITILIVALIGVGYLFARKQAVVVVSFPKQPPQAAGNDGAEFRRPQQMTNEDDDGDDDREINPKFKMFALDPQEDEYKKIREENLEGVKPLQIPPFDPNQHIVDHEAHADADGGAEGGGGGGDAGVVEIPVHRPQPKAFPVTVLATPRLACHPRVSLLMVVYSRPDNVAERAAIRRTWAKYDPDKYSVRVEIR